MNRLNIKLDEAKIQKAMGKNLYSDKYCFITEVVSNAKDSMVRAGNTTEYISVSLYEENGTYWWSVKDTGVGLTKEEMVDKLFTLMNSDKEEEENTIGNKGVGKIAFTAYNNECFYRCIKDGKGASTRMYDTEYEGIGYDDIEEFEPDEDDVTGVEFKIALCTSTSKFIDEMYKKLAYFGDIKYDILNDFRINNFKIFRNELYQVSDLAHDNLMHITIDDVYYPINYSKLNIAPIGVPVAVRFNLSDGIEVSTTREAVIYSEKFIEMLNKRIDAVIDDILNRFRKDMEESKELSFFFNNNNYTNPGITLGNKTINLHSIGKFNKTSSITPHLKGIHLETIKRFIKSAAVVYKTLGWLRYNSFKNNAWISPAEVMFQNHKVVLCEEIPRVKRRDYYKWKYSNETIYFIQREKVSLKRLKIVSELKWDTIKLVYKDTGHNMLRKFIEDWNVLTEELFKNCVIDADVVYEKEFLDGRKKKQASRRVIKQEGCITVKAATDFLVNTGNSLNPCKYEPTQLNLDIAHRNKYLTIYGKNIHLDKINNVVRMFQMRGYYLPSLKKDASIIIVSDRDVKKLEKIHNFMDVETFIKGDNKVFRRIVTQHVINEFITKNKPVFNQRELIKEHLSTQYGEDLIALNNYAYNSMVGGLFMEEAVKLVRENNYWDWNIWPTYLHVEKHVEKLKWIQYIEPRITNNIENQLGLVECMKDLCKYYKFKLNWDNYGQPIESID